MIVNRLQSFSPLFQQPCFGFATKNLKQIKIRMKAVESIRKITKVPHCIRLGNEDGGSIKDEAGRRQARKGQILRSGLSSKSHPTGSLRQQEKS